MEFEPFYTTEEFESTPEEIRGMYTEKEGIFKLNVKPKDGWDLQNVAGLTSALNKEKANIKAIKQQYSAYEGIDLEDYQEKLAKLEELQSLDVNSEVSKQVDTRLKNATEAQKAQHMKELKALQEKLSGTEANLRKVMLDGKLDAALVGAEILPDHKAMVSSFLKQQLAMEQNSDGPRVVVLTGDGDQRYNSDAKLMGVEELVAEFKASPANAAFFKGRNKQGGGMPADSQGGKPVGLSKKDPSEMTRQEKMAYWVQKQKL